MQAEEQERKARAKADLVTAIILVLLGLFVFYEAFTMDRLEARRIEPASIPGLVPMILGAGLALTGTMLAIRSARIEASGGWRALMAMLGTLSAARAGAALFLIFLFTLVLIGSMPFWAASMIFIVAYVLVFEVVLTDAPVPWVRSLLWALATAIVAGGGIYYLFSNVFLVRLP